MVAEPRCDRGARPTPSMASFLDRSSSLRTRTELAATLHAASRDRQITVLRGGGTKLGWGRTPSSIDLLVSTAKLNTLLVHRHGDLTATAHAGVTLSQFNRELARHGQWLPDRQCLRRGDDRRHRRDQRFRSAAPSSRHASRSVDRRHARAHRRTDRQGRRSRREERRRLRSRQARQRIVRDARAPSLTPPSSCCRFRRHRPRSTRRMTMGTCWRGMRCRCPRRSSSRWRSTSCSMADEYRLRVLLRVEPRGRERADRVGAATAVEAVLGRDRRAGDAMSGASRCDRRGAALAR